MGLKNLWTLNVDELLVSDMLKRNFKKGSFEVFFPLNAQMKDVDLILLNLKSNKVNSIQVKGSRTWEPRLSEVKRYGNGGATWFKIAKDTIFKPSNRIDYFVFVLHGFQDGELKKEIKIDFLVLPLKNFRRICEQKATRKGNAYHFFIWIDTKNKRAFDFNNKDGKIFPFSKYLNNWDLIK